MVGQAQSLQQLYPNLYLDNINHYSLLFLTKSHDFALFLPNFWRWHLSLSLPYVCIVQPRANLGQAGKTRLRA